MTQKILLADDDVDLVETVQDLLRAKGFAVIKAHEGVRVMELAQTESPDLILLDWKMPLGKGSAVLEMLSEKEKTQKIPVVILSGVDEPEMKATALKLGAKDFVQKPFESDDLIKIIQKVIGT